VLLPAFLNALKLFFAVLGVGANPFDYDYPASIPNLNHQPIGISLDIENNPIVRQKIG